MHTAQGGVCAICGEPETTVDPRTGKVRALSVDHTDRHGELKVRGLLCNRHNRGIGLFGEQVAILAAAIRYLERYS